MNRLKIKKDGVSSRFSIYWLFSSMFIVVRRVTNIAKNMIAIGNSASVIQPPQDMFIVAIRPIRARCAAHVISNNIGHAVKNPILVAMIDIFVTIICIWWATNLSDAPT